MHVSLSAIQRLTDRRLAGPMTTSTNHTTPAPTVLITAATGKTGRRVADRLARLGADVRAGSRTSSPPFDWTDRSTWGPALGGVDAVYVCYVPDLAVPGATDDVAAFTDAAVAAGVTRLVLLSGRGEPEAQAAERLVQRPELAWTIVRCSWFLQNLTEGFFADDVAAGELALPVDDVRAPWVGRAAVAAVVAAALPQPGPAGRPYEVTGPRLLRFDELTDAVARGTGRPVRFRTCTVDELADHVRPYGEDVVALFTYRATEVLDGRNAHLAGGVREALGREPRDVDAFVRDAVAAGAWASSSDAVR